jgi:hypothetical protein
VIAIHCGLCGLYTTADNRLVPIMIGSLPKQLVAESYWTGNISIDSQSFTGCPDDMFALSSCYAFKQHKLRLDAIPATSYQNIFIAALHLMRSAVSSS